ncbi:hypothetical protein TKK_0012029 [Trichogramma kaykai]|uniref:NADH dehydrogenase [ubiquinone] 1 beta subcomplex subunit 5, mitochondrial n=1 Tax=Trichogramma kaykai TaxID=54128 RepID=A0ABD2WNT0_9HYME
MVWSSFIRSPIQNMNKIRFLLPKITAKNGINPTQVCHSGSMVITASRWQWHKTKDTIHFYLMVAGIPITLLITYANVFVGPATLTKTPEGYEPKYWEYFRHPISRWMARNFFDNPQKDYEKNLAAIYEETQLMKVRALEQKVWNLQKERQDYKYNYFLPYDTFGLRQFRELVKRQVDGME